MFYANKCFSVTSLMFFDYVMIVVCVLRNFNIKTGSFSSF